MLSCNRTFWPFLHQAPKYNTHLCPAAEVLPEAARGLSAVYASLLQPRPAVRQEFLKGLVRRGDAICSMRTRVKDFDLRQVIRQALPLMWFGF